MPQKKRNTEGLQPTPPVGYRVLWKSKDRKNVFPADVLSNDIAYPGVVTLQTNEGNRVRLRENVHWAEHPDVLNRRDHIEFSVLEGTWQYMDGISPPDKHYDLHLAKQEADEEAVKKQMEFAEEQKKLREEFVNAPVDQRAVEVSRIQAQHVYEGATE